MDTFTTDDLHELVADRPGPCVSLYMPTHRDGTGRDSAAWRTLLKEAASRLAALGLPAARADELLAPAAELAEGGAFWRKGGDGLAGFLAPGFARHYRLGASWATRAVVSGRFFVKPLLPWVTGGRFYLLALSRNEVRLIRGTPHGAERVSIPGGPLTLETALAAHDTDEPLVVHTAGRGANRLEAIFHGHGVGIDDAKDDLLRYFRVVNRAVLPILQKDRAPLVLAGVEYLWPIFQEACTYPLVLDQGVPGCPDRVSDRVLADRARPIAEPVFRRRRVRALATYRRLAGTGRTSADAGEVVEAALRGRVDTEFLTGQDVWGRYDPGTGRAEVHEAAAPGDEELTNLAATAALRRGRAVHVLDPGEMPDGAALAAIFPLPLAKHAGKRP